MTSNDWPWRYFTRDELACKHCGECKMHARFMDRLDGLRGIYGMPLIINSGYRCKEHNKAVGGGSQSAHLYGRAVDINMRGGAVIRLMKLAIPAGFTGFGLQQKGYSRYIHLDDLDVRPGQPRPHVWTY